MSSLLQTNATPAGAFDLAGKRVFVSGHTGMAGSSIVRRLRQEPCTVLVAARREVDFTRQDQAEHYLSATRPDVVIMAAAALRQPAPPATLAQRPAFLAVTLDPTFGGNYCVLGLGRPDAPLDVTGQAATESALEQGGQLSSLQGNRSASQLAVAMTTSTGGEWARNPSSR